MRRRREGWNDFTCQSADKLPSDVKLNKRKNNEK